MSRVEKDRHKKKKKKKKQAEKAQEDRKKNKKTARNKRDIQISRYLLGKYQVTCELPAWKVSARVSQC